MMCIRLRPESTSIWHVHEAAPITPINDTTEARELRLDWLDQKIRALGSKYDLSIGQWMVATRNDVVQFDEGLVEGNYLPGELEDIDAARDIVVEVIALSTLSTCDFV